MINHVDRDHVVSCDRCSNELAVKSRGDFSKVLGEMSFRNWTSIYQDGIWLNFCPDHTATERAGGQ